MSDWFADSLYTWTFFADSGDQYSGFVFEDTGSYLPGQILDTRLGSYAITGEQAYGIDLSAYYGIEEGDVFITSYFDAVQGPLQTYNYAYLGAPSGFYGLGSEYDYAFNGRFWDDFGLGGSYQAGLFG